MCLLWQGSDHLTVTWKVCEGILQHIDVTEEGKENAFSLGKSLLIGDEVSFHTLPFHGKPHVSMINGRDGPLWTCWWKTPTRPSDGVDGWDLCPSSAMVRLPQAFPYGL